MRKGMNVMRNKAWKASAVCAAALLAALALAGPVSADCPSYRDRPSLAMTSLWRTTSSNRVTVAAGAVIEVVDQRWNVIRRATADSQGKVFFPKLPVGATVAVRSTFRGRTQYAVEQNGQIAWRTYNRCDARAGSVTHIF